MKTEVTATPKGNPAVSKRVSSIIKHIKERTFREFTLIYDINDKLGLCVNRSACCDGLMKGLQLFLDNGFGPDELSVSWSTETEIRQRIGEASRLGYDSVVKFLTQKLRPKTKNKKKSGLYLLHS